MKNKTLAIDALVISLYVGLTLLPQSFSFGQIQIRLAECLMLLILNNKHYTYPLTIACFLANILGLLLGFDVLTLDYIFGTIATYLACELMHLFKNVKYKNTSILSLLTPCIINGLIVGIELTIYFGNNNYLTLFCINFFYVFVGEFISVVIIGNLLKRLLEIEKILKSK